MIRSLFVVFSILVSWLQAQNLSAERSPQDAAGLWLPAHFSDHAVLQRDKPLPVWGWAVPGAEVEVALAGQTMAARASDDGIWRVIFMPLEASAEPIPFSVISGQERIDLQDVLVGEVWICGGQSNMEMPISPTEFPFGRGVENHLEEVREAKFPGLRLFTVGEAISKSPLTDTEGRWAVCSPQTVGEFSAAATFFGRELHRELEVPVGLLVVARGSSSALSWTLPEQAKTLPRYAEVVERELADPTPASVMWAEFDEAFAGWFDDYLAVDPVPQKEWQQALLPGSFASLGLPGYDGTVWFRKRLTVPEEALEGGAGWLLRLGPVDDMDVTWVNGVEIGRTVGLEEFATLREYPVPPSILRAGENEILVRVFDTAGHGGFWGAPQGMHLIREGGGAVALSGQWAWHLGTDLAKAPRLPSPPSFDRFSPGALFQGMVSPLAPYALRGMIFYQGEHDVMGAADYRQLLPKLIASWREPWADELPFVFAQIAPFTYPVAEAAAELRQAQLEAVRSVAGTGMVVTTDLGDAGDLHPPLKQELGRRFANWALAEVYGQEDRVAMGPLFSKAERVGAAMKVMFDHAEGLVAAEGGATGFELAGVDRKFYPAVAKIEGETVLISSPEVAEPVSVRYGWSALPEPSLRNGAGLPTSPFKTDDWPWVTGQQSAPAASAAQ